jgi:hypothetical protein
MVCFNCEQLDVPYPTFNQHEYAKTCAVKPEGVTWKFYPPRLDEGRHEIVIDNDIVFLERIPEIERFFKSDATLLMEGQSRTYGRFDGLVPVGYQINSGIYGMPPGFNLDNYVQLYAGTAWQINATGEYSMSRSFDEQGLVAAALLNHHSHIIIPVDVVPNCSRGLVWGPALHFIGLNRCQYHRPFQLYRNSNVKMHL